MLKVTKIFTAVALFAFTQISLQAAENEIADLSNEQLDLFSSNPEVAALYCSNPLSRGFLSTAIKASLIEEFKLIEMRAIQKQAQARFSNNGLTSNPHGLNDFREGLNTELASHTWENDNSIPFQQWFLENPNAPQGIRLAKMSELNNQHIENLRSIETKYQVRIQEHLEKIGITGPEGSPLYNYWRTQFNVWHDDQDRQDYMGANYMSGSPRVFYRFMKFDESENERKEAMLAFSLNSPNPEVIILHGSERSGRLNSQNILFRDIMSITLSGNNDLNESLEKRVTVKYRGSGSPSVRDLQQYVNTVAFRLCDSHMEDQLAMVSSGQKSSAENILQIVKQTSVNSAQQLSAD